LTTNTYRVLGAEETIQKVFGSTDVESISAANIITCLEKTNDEALFRNFWDVLKTPVVDAKSLEPVEEDLYTYWWDDPSVGIGCDETCPRREVYSLQEIEELQEDYGNDWEKHLETVEVWELFTQPLMVTDMRMIAYLDYVNDKTGWDLQVTLPLPPLTKQQQSVVKELAAAGRIRILQDMSSYCGEEENCTYSAVAVSEADPEDWEEISKILGLKKSIELGLLFLSGEEGTADEASATANILQSTWAEEKILDFLGLGDKWEPDLYTTVELASYPNLMSITKKDAGE
jgi:hypothetical protein